MVDGLLQGDRTFQELAETAGLAGNLAAHHLRVLEDAGLVERRVSDGDHRRRYLSLRHELIDGLVPRPPIVSSSVLFVCTHNSARSQFAAALWGLQTGRHAVSAGTHPAARVHPRAVRAAQQFGIDLSGATPQGYAAISATPDLVISVCDRAHEADLPFQVPTVHWSVPDPVATGTPAAFRAAFTDIASRIDRLGAALD